MATTMAATIAAVDLSRLFVTPLRRRRADDIRGAREEA